MSIKDIFQILICDEGRLPEPFPHEVERWIGVLRNLHPTSAYHLLGADDVRSFIASHFSSDVIDAYDTLVPYSYKCNLARYCLLLIHGGLYADIGIRFLAQLEPPSHAKFVTFRSIWLGASPWTVSAGLVWSLPGRPELRTAIDLIVENCKKKYYGCSSTDPTGPGVLGRALAICAHASDYWIGEARAITPDAQRKNVAFVLPDKTVLALGKPARGGDLSALGFAGTNDYNQFWLSRRVYGEGK